MPLGPYPPPDKHLAPPPVAPAAGMLAKWSGTLPDKTIATLVELVSRPNIEASVSQLASFHTRHSYSTTIADTAAWLGQQFQGYGFSVTPHHFTAGGHNQQNIVATRAGSGGRTFLLCGHYDCRMQDLANATARAPGANDNGSGVAILLEIARLLAQVELAHELRIVTFSGEEQGLLGSTAYAELVSGQGLDIGWLLNLDMVGYPDANASIVVERDMGNAVASNDAASQSWGDVIGGLASAYTSLSVQFGPIFASDYMPFEEAGYVVAGLWESGQYPTYHSHDDTPDDLNYAYLTEVARLALATVLTELAPYGGEADGPVDVYIRDNSSDTGNQPSLSPHWTSPDLWVRNAPPPTDPSDPNDPHVGEDPEAGHQQPINDVPNYLYVRVHNRGSQATGAGYQVEAFHCDPGTAMLWPQHFSSMGVLPVDVSIPPGGATRVGPFLWTPHIVDHECLLAMVSGPGDHAVQDVYTGSLDHSLLVRYDNNVGQRNVSPENSVPGGKIRTTFFMRGGDGPTRNDLELDASALPPDTTVQIRLLRRVVDSAGTIQQMTTTVSSSLWTTLVLKGGRVGRLLDFALRDDDRVAVHLIIDFSIDAQHLRVYPLIASQLRQGVSAGRLSIELTAIKESADYVFGNRRSRELHTIDCPFWSQMSQGNKQPFTTVQEGLLRGYNGCAFCLPDYDTG